MGVFYQTAFWGFLGLVGALIVVIYKLFGGKLDTDLQLKLAITKDQLKEHFKKEYTDQIEKLEEKVDKMSNELASFKRHEDSNSKIQVDLTKKLLKKLDVLNKIDPDFLAKILEEDDE